MCKITEDTCNIEDLKDVKEELKKEKIKEEEEKKKSMCRKRRRKLISR